jgi:hypothetical protein
MQYNIHPPLFGTIIYGKDGTSWVKRWPLGHPFLILEVDSRNHKTWGRQNKYLSKIQNRRFRAGQSKRRVWVAQKIK